MPSKKAVAKRSTAKKAAKPAPKASIKKAPARAAVKMPKPAKASKQPKKTADSTKFSLPPKVLLREKARKKGESVEGLVAERKVELKSVEEYIGMQQKQDYRNKPIIPGVFDLLIPPGTPRKLILKLAKEYPIQIVRRDDIYVPVGVSDVERDLLAIRGDEKTVRKMEKLLLKEIESFVNGTDARLHDYSKPARLEGIDNPVKSKKSSKLKAKA